MAKKSLPTSFEKRKLLNDKETDYDYYANLYVENKRYNDALDFLEKSKNREILQKIKSEALKRGDFQILLRLSKIDNGLVTEIDWKECEKSARHLGKISFADACLKILQKKSEH